MLEEIVEKTRMELEIRKRKIPADLFELEGKSRSLKKAIKSKEKAIITEIKPASPTQGMIKQVDAAKVAKAMERGGAAAISVLTEPFYFAGCLDNLKNAKQATKIPIMRKDFIVDEYQLLEAKHYGADAILLMVSVLGESTASFYDLVKELGMEALVEVHDTDELDIATSFNPEIIGINNRNLKDLKIDLNTTKYLASKLPKEQLKVSESGVKTKEDLALVLQSADAALIGTSLMKSDDIEKAVKDLLK